MYVGLRAQDLNSMHSASMFDPSSAGGTDEGSIAHESMRFYAKLTFSAVYLGITYYSWIEQQRVVDAGGGVPGFVDLPGGRFGSVPGDPTGATAFSNPATEPNNAAPIPPVIVRIGKSYFDPALGTVYIATIASATFNVTQNLSGFSSSGLNPTQSIPNNTITTLTNWAVATSGDWTCDGTNFTVNPSENTLAYVFSVALQWKANTAGSRHGVLVGNIPVGQSFRAPDIPTDFHLMSFSVSIIGGSAIGGFHVDVMQDSGGNLNVGSNNVRIYGIH